MKVCKKCGESKDPSEFGKDKTCTDGKRGSCNTCRNAAKRAWRSTKAQAKVDPAAHNYATEILPADFHIKGVSQYIKDGKVAAQWIKSAKDPDSVVALDAYLTILREAFLDIKGKFKPQKPPKKDLTSDLLDIVPIGDSHIGLMTWWEETGENFDLKIARNMYGRAYARLFQNDTRAETLVMANLGDYFHSDGGKNQTTSGTPVDVDGRWPKVLKTGVEIMIDAIRLALTRYKKVIVYTMAGNHDKEAAIALRLCLHFAFEKEPRVEVIESPKKYQFLEHGRCLVGFTHGDKGKATDLPLIMATDQKEAWGRTDHRHYYTGHVHHDTLKDMGEVTVETVRVLGPADAWHTESGYRSRRDIKIDTWSKKYGMIDRSVFGIKRVMDQA